MNVVYRVIKTVPKPQVVKLVVRRPVNEVSQHLQAALDLMAAGDNEGPDRDRLIAVRREVGLALAIVRTELGGTP